MQEQSWEPEILISGVVLFALFQIPGQIAKLGHFLDHYSLRIFLTGNVDDQLTSLLLAACYWLIAGFTAHLVLRSVWIAFVGLSYVYPKGINKERLTFRQPFAKNISKTPDYQSRILRLENIASTAFAASFLIFMCVIGAFFFLGVAAAIIGLIYEYSPQLIKTNEQAMNTILSTVALIYLFDFLSLGLLKRIPYFSKIYYPLYLVMSFLTLAPLYRSIYYGFISNHPRWKVFLFLVIFTGASFLLVRQIRTNNLVLGSLELNIRSSDETLFHGHYDNLMGDKPSHRIQVNSDVIRTNLLEVFIVHKSGYEKDYIFTLCNYSELSQNSGLDQDSLKLSCLKDFYSLRLNGKNVSNQSFLFHEKQATNQVGLRGYVDLSNLSRGMHTLELLYQFEKDEEPVTSAFVQFYKASPGTVDVSIKEQSTP